jgi:hypothetical protein
MSNPKDRHLQTPGEANRDKHINFLAIENGDIDPASENIDDNYSEKNQPPDVDNGFFTDDDNSLKTEDEYEEDKENHSGKNEKFTPLEPDTTTSTLGDRISVNPGNADLLTRVKDDNTEPYANENEQQR